MLVEGGYSRRRFLKSSTILGAGGLLAGSGLGCGGQRFGAGSRRGLPCDLAIAKGASPADNCRAAVEALGGFGNFVSQGDRVVVKPNPIGNQPPEMAINTHPDMVAVVVRGCLEAGAREVLVVSNDGRRSFIANGTAAAIEQAGGSFKAIQSEDDYREIVIPRSKILRRERISTDVLGADVFINMPIAKHHAGAEVTFAMKNLMGVNWDRIRFHRTDLQLCIAELAGAVPHNLVIMDANHVLLTNGPGGPGEVSRIGQVVAGVDPVAVDAFSTRYLNRTPESIGHIRLAHDLGVGSMDLSRLKIREYEA